MQYTSRELEVIQSLSDNRNIITRNTDNGSCVIIQDGTDYLLKTEKQLNNSCVYKNVQFKKKLLVKSNNVFRKFEVKS